VSNPTGRTGQPEINLKNPTLAAVLAWLVPGLGHVYQRRTAKGILFFVCIMGIFLYGLYLGGNHDLGWGRVVYVSWQPGHRRLPYLCQIGVGLPALPAMVEARRARDGRPLLFGGFMAPPRPAYNETVPQAMREALAEQPLLDTIHRQLARNFEFGTTFTMIAGLLNVLVICDAWGGPFPVQRRKEDEDEAASAPAENKTA